MTKEVSPDRPSAAVKPDEASAADRVNRQNRLLDDGLMETFPASDPVSVVRVE